MTFLWILLFGGTGLAFGPSGLAIGCFVGMMFARFIEHRCFKIRHSKAYQRAIAKQKLAATLDPDKYYEKGLDADKALIGNTGERQQMINVFTSAAIHNPIDGFATVEAASRSSLAKKPISHCAKYERGGTTKR